MPAINPQDAKAALTKAVNAAQTVQVTVSIEAQRIQLAKQSKAIGATTPPAPTKPLS